MPRLGELYPGICLTTEEKARKTLSQCSQTVRIHTPHDKNTYTIYINLGKLRHYTEIQPYIDKK